MARQSITGGAEAEEGGRGIPSRSERPLVVGAGPVGLAAALFLARRGPPPRVVEQRVAPSTRSRALAVNPRTLDLLADTGVTDRMLELGRPIRGGRFHFGSERTVSISFAGVHPRYPFMLALSQAATERLLARALEESGGEVERGVELVGCRPVAGGVEAALLRADGCRETVRAPWLLAADGAHSAARRELDVAFPGSAFAEPWHLVDAPLRTPLEEDRAHVFFREDGAFVFAIPVVDDVLARRVADPLWRVIANRPCPLAQLDRGKATGPAEWESSFLVSHRLAETFATRGVFLAGDAAHVHSPIGARGMNLGVEDARVFAELVLTGRAAEYARMRRPVDRSVVRRVEVISRVAAATSPLLRRVRRLALPVAAGVPFLRARMARIVTGLDHALPEQVAEAIRGAPAPRPPARPP